MAKMAADCGSPTNIRPFGPKASGPADLKSAVQCFMAGVSAAGRLPAVKASPNKAARRRQVIERRESLLRRKQARSFRGGPSIIAICAADARTILAFRGGTHVRDHVH